MILWYGFDMQMLWSLQAEEELKAACARQALQLQEMGRRERLRRAEVGRAKEQVGRWEHPQGGGQSGKGP